MMNKSHSNNPLSLFPSAVYVTCNIPVFLNYVLYSFTWLAGNKYTSMYSNTFLYWYSWSLTFVVSVGINSACNPLVLFWRLTTFRDWVKGRFRMMVELSQRFKALGLSGAGWTCGYHNNTSNPWPQTWCLFNCRGPRFEGVNIIASLPYTTAIGVQKSERSTRTGF